GLFPAGEGRVAAFGQSLPVVTESLHLVPSARAANRRDVFVPKAKKRTASDQQQPFRAARPVEPDPSADRFFACLHTTTITKSTEGAVPLPSFVSSSFTQPFSQSASA